MGVDGGEIARDIGDKRIPCARRAAHSFLIQVGEFRQLNRPQRSPSPGNASRDFTLVVMLLDLRPVPADVLGQSIEIDGVGYRGGTSAV